MKSSTSYRPRVACLAAIGFAILGMSCSSSNLQSVSGKVLHKGQPIKGAVVTLHPKGGENDAKAQRPSGVTDENGKFTLATRVGTRVPRRGITSSQWSGYKSQRTKVERSNRDGGHPEATDAFKGRYSDVKSSKLTVTIKPGMHEIETINLD